MRELLGRIMDVYPVLMNADLGGAVGEAFAPLAQVVLTTPEDAWACGARESVLAEQQRLNELFREQRAEFYAVPFPERPDVSFLMRRRARMLVNVDDVPSRATDAA